MKTIKIAHLYYDLMNLYGENGNIRFLKKKLEDQGFNVKVSLLSLEDKIDYGKYDFYYIGTGSEENKELVLSDMIKSKDKIIDAINDKKFFLVTGNALELFGKKIYKADGTNLDCIGAYGYASKEENERIVGEQYYKCDLIAHNIVGFQNRAYSMSDNGDNLFKVIKGTGYNRNVGFEGIHDCNFYGTYLLGPILVRNPYFTDYLIEEICKYFGMDYKEADTHDMAYKAYHEYLNNFQLEQ